MNGQRLVARLAATALLAMLAMRPAMAATVTLKSGEHDGFTRLVLQLPLGADWSLSRQARRADLRITGATVDFDLSTVFDRIPRSRLARLAPGTADGVLRMHLDCACQVRGFIEGDRFLVIDIADPNPATSAADNPILPYRFARLPSPNAAVGELAVGMPVPVGPQPTEPATDNRASLPPIVPDLSIPDTAESQLIQQVLRASGQGLLELRVVPEAAIRSDAGAPGAAENVSILPATAPEPAARVEHPGSACPWDGLTVYDWGDDRSFSAQMARYQSALVTEFDRIDPEAAMALARAYLFFGFGAEARAVLDLAAANSPQVPLLRSLSWLLDGESPAAPGPLAGHQHCEGDVAFWSALAEPVDKARVNRAAVLRGFARLPAHLRHHLGPVLASRFTDIDDRSTADALLRIAARTGAGPDPAALLAKAATDRLRDDPAAATAKLRQVAGSGAEQAPRALIALVTAQYQDRATVDPGMADLIAAYALELRQSTLGPDLRRTQALALALTGRFDDAMAAIEEVTERDGRDAARAALEPVLTLMTEDAGDIVFLRHVLPMAPDEFSITAALTNALARRLLDLGFAEHAGHLLAAAEDGDVSEARRLLRAETALGRGLPHRTMVELLGLDGPEPARLRAAAMAQTGNYAAFSDYMLRAQDRDAALRGLWLTGSSVEDVDGGDGDGDGHYERIAGLSRRIVSEDPETQTLPPLAQARALLDGSLSLRTDIARLLDGVAGMHAEIRTGSK